MKKILLLLLVVVLVGFLARFGSDFTIVNQVSAAEGSKVFTVEELAEFDGIDGNDSYTSYKGVVYDVTDSKLWKLGEHFGLRAGKDLTRDMEEAPHGDEVFAGFTVLGTLEGFEQESDLAMEEEAQSLVGEGKEAEKEDVAWYGRRLRPGGFSILGWTGIVLGIVFVLTFATCFALPWAKLPLPWKGKKIGPDPLDEAGKHLTWSSIHKHFVWITVIFGIIHGIIGFLQMMGIYL